MPLSLASSVAPQFDIITTVDYAQEYGFKSVQLFIGEPILDQDIEHLVLQIHDKCMESVVFHLPDLHKLTPEITETIEKILNLLPSNLARVGLIHYSDEVPFVVPGLTPGKGDATHPFLSQHLPKFKNMVVGLENSKIREFDPRHVMRAFRLARENNVP
ncbi:MAG: hypothetical protein ACMG57_00930, partial [Candidatus Dojkabacteria bacterium]